MDAIKPIPIQRAKEIAALGYDEVIIVGANYQEGTQHVTTYGKSQKACENAAIGGNAIKKLLKWPDELSNAKPARQKRKEGLKKWTDNDMVSFASKCYFNHNDKSAFSDLLSEYEKESQK